MAYSFGQIIKKKQSIIWWWLIGVLAVVTLVSFIQPLKYSAESQVLVVPDYRQTTDPYQISKTNEYLSSLLAQVTYSSSFFEATAKPEYQIDATYFGNTSKKRMSKWQKTIEVKALNDSGIISVKAYHPDKQQAEKLVRAINYNLITKNNFYHGLGDKVVLKVIDEPLVSLWPAKPNLPVNFALAFILGLLLGLIHIYLTSAEDEYSEIDEAVINWPSSEVVEEYVSEPIVTQTEVAEAVGQEVVTEQEVENEPMVNNFVPQNLVMETIIDGQDITENLSRGGNIDNIFR
ncbi:MAG TPA: hypothetical protein PLT32_01445 [bacterium]|nr:hypothetical protein [bacterium]